MTDPVKNSAPESELQKLVTDCAHFLVQRQSVMLATVNAAGIPDASYAPFVLFNGNVYIFVSELATHARNLMETVQAGLLFIEDETQTPQPFARRRLQMQCKATELGRDDKQFGPILTCFRKKFGSVMDILLNLQDFHLFCLHPKTGTFIEGFGRAFELEEKALRQITDNAKPTQRKSHE